MLTSVSSVARDRQEGAVEVGGPELAPLPADRALARVVLERGNRARRDQGHLGRRRRAGPRPSRARSRRRRRPGSGGPGGAGRRRREASRASPGRTTGRRSRAAAGRRIPCRHRPVRACRKRIGGASRPGRKPAGAVRTPCYSRAAMRLIITEKNNSAHKIADILSGGQASEDATYKVPFYTWTDADRRADGGRAQGPRDERRLRRGLLELAGDRPARADRRRARRASRPTRTSSRRFASSPRTRTRS